MHDLNKTKQSSQTCILRCQIDYEWFSSANDKLVEITSIV